MKVDCSERRLAPFFVVWSGQAVSLIGTQAVQFALVWWLTVRTGSATVLATATFVALAPQIVLGPFVGALVDRWNRKWIMLASDGAMAAASALLALSFLDGSATSGQVFALLFVRALGAVFHGTAMTAATSMMVPVTQLTRIQGLNQMLQGGQLIVSAPLGALLFSILTMAGVMAVDVVTAAVAIVSLSFVAIPRPESSRSGSRPESLFESVGAGLGYLRRRTGHTTLLAIGALVNLCMVPAFSLLPLLVVEQGGGAARLGGMTSIFGAGTLAGGVLLGLWGGFHRRIHTTALGLLGAGLATVALALAPSAGLALAAVAAVGLAIPLVNGPIQALLQATIAADYQGRVFTLYGSVCAMMTPIGLAAAAPIADWLGVRAWFVAGGTICLGMALLGALSPSLRRIEEADAVGAAVLRQQS